MCRHYYTVSKAELEGLARLEALRKPELRDMIVVSRLEGWSTVYVPKWDKSIREFYGLLSCVTALPKSLGRFAPIEVVRGAAVAAKRKVSE